MLKFLNDLVTGNNYREYSKKQKETMFPLEQFFPFEKVDSLEINMLSGSNNLPIILRPAAMEEKAQLRQREGLEVKKQKGVYYKEGFAIGTEELAKLEILEGRSPLDPKVKRVIKGIYNDQNTLKKGSEATMEFMRSQLMSSGIILAKDGAADIAIDYQLKPEQKFTCSTAWTDPASKPLDDLRKNRSLAKLRGENPNVVMFNTNTMDNLLKNEQILNAAKALTPNGQVFMNEGLVEAVIKSQLKLTVLINDEMYKKSDGSVEGFWPNNKVSLFSSQNLPGKSNYGTTPQQLMLNVKNKDVTELNNGAAYMYIKWEDDPVTKKTIVDMNALPSLEGGNALQILTVA